MESEEGAGFFGARVADGCEPANMGALKRQVFLAAEPRLQHFHLVFLSEGFSLTLAC